MARLTKRFVESVEAEERDLVFWDDRLPGFGLRVKPSGVRSYLVQYRNRQGRSRRYTIGRHGVLTVEEAREEAREVLRRAKLGGDPATERKTARQAPTMAELCDRFLDEHVDVHTRTSTAREYRRLVEVRIKPEIGTLKVTAVSRADVINLHRKMRGTPQQANRVLAVLSKLFSLAELWMVRPENSNPCRMVKRYAETTRDRFLSEAELTRLGAVLDQAERERLALPDFTRTVRLLALTGCRLGEILGLRWEHVDFEAGTLELPDAKAGARVQPVAASAVAVLASIPRVEGSPWVLHGAAPGRRLSVNTVEQTWRRLRGRAGLADVRLHDLRHTVGTYAGQVGANAYLVRDLLGHKTLAMTNRYVSRDADPLKDLAEQVESRIAAAMAGGTAEVVNIVSQRNRALEQK